MASTTFCDWCGELIEVPVGREALKIKVNGHAGNGRYMYNELADGFEIHAVLLDGWEVDPDCCLGKLETLLAERANWAHDPEQQSHEWRLVPCGDSQPILGRSQRRNINRVAAGAEQRAKAEAEQRSYRKWKEFSKDERKAMIRNELLEGDKLTTTELAKRLEQEDMRVWADRVGPLMREMFDRGELERQEERWGNGSRIRFRYSIAAGAEAA